MEIINTIKIEFTFNTKFPINSLNLMRGVLIADEDNYKEDYINEIFEAIWGDGLNLNDQNIIDKILKNMGVNPKTFFLRSTTEVIKTNLKKITKEAFLKGIFGAPTFVVRDKIFWGQDRLEFALNEIKK